MKRKSPYTRMAERCGRAEVRENNLIAAIEKAIKELTTDEGAPLATLMAALIENKKE
jgi:hypothetical protein